MGDRAVYFVTSFKGTDGLHDEQPRFDEPSQHINDADHKHDRLIASTTVPSTTDEIASGDDPNVVPEQENNAIGETTTSRFKKFPKLGRNASNLLTGSRQLFLVGITVILFMTKF